VLPDGFIVELEPLAEPGVLPDELPLPLMVLPLEPVVPVLLPMPLPIPAAPPPEPPPAPLPPAPPLCAMANVPDSANAVANAIVVSFIFISSWLRGESITVIDICSGASWLAGVGMTGTTSRRAEACRRRSDPAERFDLSPS
jgi:hypothetical protein